MEVHGVPARASNRRNSTPSMAARPRAWEPLLAVNLPALHFLQLRRSAIFTSARRHGMRARACCACVRARGWLRVRVRVPVPVCARAVSPGGARTVRVRARRASHHAHAVVGGVPRRRASTVVRRQIRRVSTLAARLAAATRAREKSETASCCETCEAVLLCETDASCGRAGAFAKPNAATWTRLELHLVGAYVPALHALWFVRSAVAVWPAEEHMHSFGWLPD